MLVQSHKRDQQQHKSMKHVLSLQQGKGTVEEGGVG